MGGGGGGGGRRRQPEEDFDQASIPTHILPRTDPVGGACRQWGAACERARASCLVRPRCPALLTFLHAAHPWAAPAPHISHRSVPAAAVEAKAAFVPAPAAPEGATAAGRTAATAPGTLGARPTTAAPPPPACARAALAWAPIRMTTSGTLSTSPYTTIPRNVGQQSRADRWLNREPARHPQGGRRSDGRGRAQRAAASAMVASLLMHHPKSLLRTACVLVDHRSGVLLSLPTPRPAPGGATAQEAANG